jgi:hypothetical protein
MEENSVPAHRHSLATVSLNIASGTTPCRTNGIPRMKQPRVPALHN